mmetsp:Transcript_7886/g.14861  ORF Transcript_7886/g.14861 Transcript_7886/m.14861 type:complete len:282 (-) Transcript_7886:102-947(-)
MNQFFKRKTVMMDRTMCASLLVLIIHLLGCGAFQFMISDGVSSLSFHHSRKKILSPSCKNLSKIAPRNAGHSVRILSSLFFHYRQPDIMEEFVGGMRYEMVELPDSLVDTTVFVGNLCEFVTDDMLSAVFQQASALNFVPACVARKPDSSSLKYGFVTFPTVEEKEAAIIRFTGHLLNDRPMRVESIIDYKYRVRVPEKLVFYTVGEAKKTKDGSKNTMRMVQNSRDESRDTRLKQKTKMKRKVRTGSGKNESDSYRALDGSQGKRKRVQGNAQWKKRSKE